MIGVTYILMNVLPRNSQQKYVFIFVLGYLSYSHYSRMVHNFGGYDMDISTYTMLLICKLNALSWCYRDGGENPKDLTEDQRVRKVDQMPSPLELLSYTFYANACAVGVFFEFSDYKRFIERTAEYKNVPSPILASLKTLLIGLICLGLFIACLLYTSDAADE